jgi:DNA topoisomerase-1
VAEIARGKVGGAGAVGGPAADRRSLSARSNCSNQQEYWSISAQFEHDSTRFSARLVGLDGKKIDRLTIGDKGSADAAKAGGRRPGAFTVATTETKPFTRNPPPPFTTSTLAAGSIAQARLLGEPHDAARAVALRGRADHLHADDGVQMADEAISRRAPRRSPTAMMRDMCPDKPRHYSSKAKNAQEAHEAIRVTDFTKDRAAAGDHANYTR